MANHGTIRQGGSPTLRRIICRGEVLPTVALIEWMSKPPHVKFTNLYGPTETTDIACM